MPMLARLFSSRRVAPAIPSIPDGLRVYAIGDLHGEAMLFQRLLAKIEQDSLDRGPADIRIIILGDIIDRGPSSALLLETLASTSSDHVITLRGNHEAAMLNVLDGVTDDVGPWLRYGGAETLASYGIDPEGIDPDNEFRMMRRLRDAVPAHVVEWLRNTPLHHTIGDYFFVHAGVRPGIDLDMQFSSDLMWIRDEFLESKANHGAIVVHGHSIEHGPAPLDGNRIGIDTGAYMTGRLTALGIEGRDRWLIDVADARDLP